jgi:acetylornithine deacetylase/succinyl-diaminopimelate desuccinylase-like protein
VYGGAVQNPIHALVMILGSLRGTDGHILVEGFYDSVPPLSDADRAQVAEVPFDVEMYMEEIGVEALFGEAGYTPREHTWVRPTLEINGIWGGFQGDGVKTVLPNAAHAKITCRLVPNQDPSVILDLLAAHVERHTPPGVRLNVTRLGFTAQPYLIPADHPGNQAARAVLEEIYGRSPYIVRTGGSIPVCTVFLQTLGVYTVGFAFGLEDEHIHAPDEFFRLISFARGPVAYCKLLQRLGESTGAML